MFVSLRNQTEVEKLVNKVVNENSYNYSLSKVVKT